ncbi:MAG: hypothetical protein IJ244_04490 [Bacteroidaceae bacterium]|nr:hypothetical protein [Bacteroidaceae bacterium]
MYSIKEQMTKMLTISTLRCGGGMMVFVLFFMALPALAQSVQTECRKDGMTVSYTVPLLRPVSNYATIVTPLLCGPNDTIALEPITVRGAKNARLLKRSLRLNHKGQPLQPYIKADEMPATVSGTYELSLAAHPWAKGAPLTLCTLVEREGCCKVETVDRQCSNPFQYAWKPPFSPIISMVDDNTGRAGALQQDNPVLEHISRYRPYDHTRILRKEKGALYVHFSLDKIDLRRDFRDNASTLDRIIDITRQIMADTTSSVKKIQIIGFASIEGSVKHNEYLGQGRAEALRNYVVRELHLPDEMFDVYNGAEAWTEFRDQLIDEPYFEGRDEAIRIIDTEPNLDRRELRLKQLNGGRTYRYIKQNILADQRNSGYIRIYWDYVPDEAARTINAASQLLAQQKFDEALQQLRTVQSDSRAWNALAVALYETGHESEALEYFRRSAQQGNKQAAENLQQLEQ